jgi:hypothetical protein
VPSSSYSKKNINERFVISKFLQFFQVTHSKFRQATNFTTPENSRIIQLFHIVIAEQGGDLARPFWAGRTKNDIS